MTRIRFIHNWNKKLDNEVFTTIRSWNQEKQDYYEGVLRGKFDVELKGKKRSEAILWDVVVCDYKDIDVAILRVDTGLHKKDEIDSLFARFGCYKNDKCILLTFKNLTKEKENEMEEMEN